MTEDGDPRDNVIAERVNGILKNEYFAHSNVNTIKDVRIVLAEAVDLYNKERPYLSVDVNVF